MVYKKQIQKDKVHAVIRTNYEKIEGYIFKLPQNRLLDMLNHSSENFIPVSMAKVSNVQTGKLLFETDFLAVNKNHIIVIAENASPEFDWFFLQVRLSSPAFSPPELCPRAIWFASRKD